MSNPFNRTLDWALQGKLVRVHNDLGVFRGWCERVHHNRGSLVLHDAKRADTLEDLKRSKDSFERVGSVFIRTVDVAMALKPKKKISYMDPSFLKPHPLHDMNFEPKDAIVRRCYRNGFAGSFPVVTQDNVIINGHKRVEAAKLAGLTYHPVEVVHVTDEQAEELYRIAHRNEDEDAEPEPAVQETDDER